MIKLSEPQKRVMKWLGYGWKATRMSGIAFEVNGQKICNLDTLTALRHKGLVVEEKPNIWVATEEGRNLTGQLCL